MLEVQQVYPPSKKSLLSHEQARPSPVTVPLWDRERLRAAPKQLQQQPLALALPA